MAVMLARSEIFTAVSAEVLLGYDEVFVIVNALSYKDACYVCINTFTAIVDLSRFNNSCLKSPASTLVDLTFQ